VKVGVATTGYGGHKATTLRPSTGSASTLRAKAPRHRADQTGVQPCRSTPWQFFTTDESRQQYSGAYPEAHGWLHIVDAVFGLALVAYSEEIVFRRCARHLFQIYLNDGYAMVGVTSNIVRCGSDA
jgi:hypothetical protein